MAYVAAVSSSQEPAAQTTMTLSNPGGVQVGDLLVAMCSRDNTGTAITSNWTIPAGGEITAGSIRMACAYKRVTSLPVDPCTFTGASEEWAGCTYIVRDYFYDSADSDCIDIVASGSDAAGPPYTSPAPAVNYAGSLILTAVGVDGAVNPVPSGGDFVVEDAQDAVGVSFLSGWTVEPTDGTATAVDFIGTTTTNTLVFLQIAIRNATGGRVPVVTDPALHTVIDTGYHRERSAAYANETTTANFLGWNVRNPTHVYQDDGGVFTDLTTAATNATDADVAFPSTEAINDAIYIGDTANQFSSLVVDRAGCTNGVAGVIAIEYWNGSAWVAVQKLRDLTSNLTATVADRQVINWRTPIDQALTTVNSVSAYWIRLRVTTLYSTNPTISQIRVAEAGLVYDAYGAVADTGIVPFWSSNAVSPANTYIGCHTGMIRDLGTTIDLNVAERYLVGTYQFTSPREYYDTGAADLGYGVRLPLLDASNNYRSWVIGGFAYPQCAGDKRVTWAVQPSQSTDTSHSVSGTAPNFDNARKWVISQGSYADEVTNIYHSYMAFANRAIIQGGSTTGLANWSDIKRAINGSLFPYYLGGQLYIPVQFGGGKLCAVDCNLATMDFVKVAGSVYGGMIHVDEGVLGVIIKGAAGDVIKIRNSTITSESRIRFEVDSASSASATYDFSGTTVVNATVTLRAVGTFADMNFINCPTLTQNGATITGGSNTNSKITSDAPNLISGVAFTSGGTGHAIEITTPGTYTFAGNSFSGFGADGTTDAAIYNNSGGAVTLNVTGASAPTVRNGAGASTTVNSNVSVTLTGLKNPSEVRVFLASTTTEVSGTGAENVTSGTHVFSVGSGVSVDIAILALGYQNLRILAYSTTSDASIPVSQALDRQYANA